MLKSAAGFFYVFTFILTVSFPSLLAELKNCSLTSTGKIPLMDLGPGFYKGEQGGLYPGGKNTVPEAHLQAGIAIADSIQPLDASGNPDPANGKIVFISISMSNGRLEFDGSDENSFMNQLGVVGGKASDLSLNAKLVIVNCAEGGGSTDRWLDSNDQRYQMCIDSLKRVGATPLQVQVAWLKYAQPTEELRVCCNQVFPLHAERQKENMVAALHVLKDKFPNLKIAHMSSRTRAYRDVPNSLNPEPFAYETNFAAKWVIEDQIEGDPDLNYDPAKGAVKAPWLAWGANLWTDGLNPRSDGLIWECGDTIDDGVHPSSSGIKKVADQLIAFYKTSPTATPWFLKKDVAIPVTITSEVVETNPFTVRFGATGSSQLVSWNWNFDDGTSSTDSSPQKIFFVADSYTVRLAVSDQQGNLGTHSLDVSVASDTPANSIPTVEISAPDDGFSFNGGAAITFTGSASDTEDGDLTAALAWSSSLDGALGNGGSVTAALSPGTHTITASITDSGGLSSSDTIIVSVAQAQRQLHFAQIADGEGLLSSEILLLNPDPEGPAGARVFLRSPGGNPLTMELNGQVVTGETDNIVVPALGMVRLQTGKSQGPVVTGSVTVSSDKTLAGVIVFGGSTGLAGVGNSLPMTSGFVAPMENDVSRQVRVGIAIMNLESRDIEVTLQLFDASGHLVATKAGHPIAALGRAAEFLDELFPPDQFPTLELSNFQGVLKATSSTGTAIAGTVIETRPSELLTMPVTPAGLGLEELNFAQFADGEGISSEILLLNPDSSAMSTAQISLKDPAGQALTVDLNGETAEGILQVPGVLPQGLKVLRTDGEGKLATGSVSVSQDVPLAGVILFSGPVGAAGVGNSVALPSGFVAPMVNNSAKQRRVGIAVMNLESHSIEVTLHLFDASGQPVATRLNYPIAAGRGRDSKFLDELFLPDQFPDLDLSDFQGVLKVTTAGDNIAATVVEVRPGQFSTLPVVPLP